MYITSSGYRTSPEKFTYLGLQIKEFHSSLFKENFPPLLSKLQSNIQFWKTLPISLLGRVNAIQMNLLPQLLYSFQNIPVFLHKSFLKNRLGCAPFPWHYKTHRIGKKLQICRSKIEGSSELPNVLSWYWASQIMIMAYCWMTQQPHQTDLNWNKRHASLIL